MLRAPMNLIAFRERMHASLGALVCVVVVIAPAIATAATSSVPNFERLTLSDARQLMLERNRELALARHAVESAEADITIAGQRPNPMLSLGTTHLGPWHGPDPVPLRDRAYTVVGVTQLFERGGKREIRTQAAQYAAAAVRR